MLRFAKEEIICVRKVFIRNNFEIPVLREFILGSEKVYLQGISNLGSQHIWLDVSLNMDKTYGD